MSFKHVLVLWMVTDSVELICQGKDKEVQNMYASLEELKNEGRREAKSLIEAMESGPCIGNNGRKCEPDTK